MKPLASVIAAAVLLGGCTPGMFDDAAKTALAFSESVSGNTIENLTIKHDLETAAYAASYCGQPRIGAVERRYRDPVHMHQRLAMCEIERQLGFGR